MCHLHIITQLNLTDLRGKFFFTALYITREIIITLYTHHHKKSQTRICELQHNNRQNNMKTRLIVPNRAAMDVGTRLIFCQSKPFCTPSVPAPRGQYSQVAMEWVCNVLCYTCSGLIIQLLQVGCGEIYCLDSCPFLILINLYSFDFVVLALCLLKLILIFFHIFFFIIYSVIGVPLYHHDVQDRNCPFPQQSDPLNLHKRSVQTEICQCCVAGSK